MIRSVIQHLRFPFSVLLLPIFLFALSESDSHHSDPTSILLLFFILHLLVYPSSNAYNSLQDQDKGSIGLVKNPLPAAKELKWITILFDLLAILLATTININTAIGVAIYILFSRLYSYRKIRLKKYLITGFLVVFTFQGFWIYVLTQYVANGTLTTESFIYGLCASCLIGAIYPLSQIYQHKQDKEDGVISISFLLGYTGTFIFSGFLFILGTILFTSMHLINDEFAPVLIFTTCQLPVILFFLYWFYKVWKDPAQANFTHTMRMNILSALCMNCCFIILYFCR